MNKNFEIFISFKATDGGKLTRDVQIASELYEALSSCGFRVFFSSETLHKGGSADFSKEIDSALDSARLLIVVASKLEYFSSRWIEYEWKSFNSDILSDIKKNAQIITYTEEMDIRQFPRILRYVQNYSYGDRDNLLTFVQAFFDRISIPERVKIEEEKSQKKETGISAAEHNIYNPAENGELEIFKLRERRSYQSDMQAIKYVKSQMNQRKYNVLMLGCAYGFTAETRFGLDDEIENVICIDKCEDVLEKARKLYSNYPHMKFYNVEIQNKSYPDRIAEILKENGIEAVDIVFASDIFRYLNAPGMPIRGTRKFLRRGGYFICKGCDDSKKTAYPDGENILGKVLDACNALQGMPNYYIGKELPIMLQNSGFHIRNIMMHLISTVNMSFEEKEELFLGTFGRRKNIANQILRRDPNTKQKVEGLLNAIDEFEDIFYNMNFWYSEATFLYVAQKE